MSLADKIRESRRIEIPVKEMKFFSSRPSVEEYGAMYLKGTTNAEVARRYVDGWEGVRECDLFPGGSKNEVKFDKELWREAIGDLMEIYNPIAEALIAATQKQIEAKAKNKKN
tara:strand:+ start:88 stop:426 length:339 start_codon:yes stop_codon:yes gene_type:complete